MEMNKETFEKMALVEKIIFKSIDKRNTDNWLEGTLYSTTMLRAGGKKAPGGVEMANVYRYENKYVLEVYRKGENQRIKLEFEDENKTYDMLYRFLFMPDTIIYEDTEEAEEDVEIEDTNNRSGFRFAFHLFSFKNTFTFPNGDTKVYKYQSHGGMLFILYLIASYGFALYNKMSYSWKNNLLIGAGIAVGWNILTMIFFFMRVKAAKKKLLRDVE
jgi:hypothetical protein